jgi:hypothetical protein
MDNGCTQKFALIVEVILLILTDFETNNSKEERLEPYSSLFLTQI